MLRHHFIIIGCHRTWRGLRSLRASTCWSQKIRWNVPGGKWFCTSFVLSDKIVSKSWWSMSSRALYFLLSNLCFCWTVCKPLCFLWCVQVTKIYMTGCTCSLCRSRHSLMLMPTWESSQVRTITLAWFTSGIFNQKFTFSRAYSPDTYFSVNLHWKEIVDSSVPRQTLPFRWSMTGKYCSSGFPTHVRNICTVVISFCKVAPGMWFF